MPAPLTTAEFIDLVQKSGVIDASRLAAYLQPLRDAKGLPDTPIALAHAMVRDAVLTHFQAEQLLLGKWKRFAIGKYKVLERLGTGGMGQVFLCEHKMMRRRVAVKVLPSAKADDEASLERFYREARAAASLDHPNLVRAFDIDQDQSLHFLVMEFIDGTNLHELVKKSGPLPPARASQYIYQAALGLHYAFECAGLVHRDIKPGNILVDRSGVVKILDMGLARFFHDEDDLLTKKYDETLGTADYLSPEQALDSHRVDIRADIYSLGATFYYLLTGQPPFTDGTVAQKLMWHQSRRPTAIRSLRPEVPAEIAAIVDRMMMKDPDSRYTTPADVAGALEPFIQTPIEPPSELELPQLSPAARAGMGPQTTSSGRVAISRLVPINSAAAAVAAKESSDKNQASRPVVAAVSASARASAAVASTAATPAGLSPGYNPFANLPDSIGSGPPSPLAKQIYAMATSRAGAKPILPRPVPRPSSRTFWLLVMLAAASLLTFGAFLIRQHGLAWAPRAVSPPVEPGLVQPE